MIAMRHGLEESHKWESYSSKKVIVDLVYGTTTTAGCEASCVYSYLGESEGANEGGGENGVRRRPGVLIPVER